MVVQHTGPSAAHWSSCLSIHTRRARRCSRVIDPAVAQRLGGVLVRVDAHAGVGAEAEQLACRDMRRSRNHAALQHQAGDGGGEQRDGHH
eukprot:scaffold12989_cov147-Isochrysis_galbana.AAC.2